ncbi:MAG: SAM-dependent methyltransferase [Pseudonocardiaceae bacterium]
MGIVDASIVKWCTFQRESLLIQSFPKGWRPAIGAPRHAGAYCDWGRSGCRFAASVERKGCDVQCSWLLCHVYSVAVSSRGGIDYSKGWCTRVTTIERPTGAPGPNGSGPWSTAGIRDCWLNGSDHTTADREVAERILVGAPHLAHVVRVYRALLGRVVRYLVGAGVQQFLDLGSGLPTVGNVHEVAQDLNPACRVVYVDMDPWVVAESHGLLAGNHDAAMVRADLRHPEQVLDAATRCGLLDLGAPVAVLAIDVLHHVPDVDNPVGFIAAYMDAVSPGSYVSVAHTGDDGALVAGLEAFHNFYHIPVPLLTFRSPTQVARFFDRLDLVEPGIVPLPLWHPELDGDLGLNPESFPACCGLGRKL